MIQCYKDGEVFLPEDSIQVQMGVRASGLLSLELTRPSGMKQTDNVHERHKSSHFGVR